MAIASLTTASFLLAACTLGGDSGGSTSASTPTASQTPLEVRPYAEVLSVEEMPSEQVSAFVNVMRSNPSDVGICEAAGLGADLVSSVTGVAAEELSAVALSNSSGVRCTWQAPASKDAADGNDDGLVDVVSTYVGEISDEGRDVYGEVPVEAVVETPDGLSVQEGILDPEFLEGVDPGIEVTLYELEVGTRVSVSVSEVADDPSRDAASLLDQVIATLSR